LACPAGGAGSTGERSQNTPISGLWIDLLPVAGETGRGNRTLSPFEPGGTVQGVAFGRLLRELSFTIPGKEKP